MSWIFHSTAELVKDSPTREALRPRREGVELRRREAAARPGPRPVPFLEAAHRDCRWPLWDSDSEPKLVCGAPRIPDVSYCREHWRLSRRR
jgi:hypothetical protein